MRLKPITAIIVLLLVVASLLVSGCTNNTTNQTPSASTATHDAFLENYLAVAKSDPYKNESRKAWEVTWINSTSAHLEETTKNNTTNVTKNAVSTYTVFPTTQDATNYLNAMNKTGYSLASTDINDAQGYQKRTGHAPQVYKYYVLNEFYTQHFIVQFDNLVKVGISKQL